jgi:hypothetical protein
LFFLHAIENNGEEDGTRSGGLCRGSERLSSIFNTFESTLTDEDQASWIVSPVRAAIKRATLLGRKNV